MCRFKALCDGVRDSAEQYRTVQKGVKPTHLGPELSSNPRKSGLKPTPATRSGAWECIPSFCQFYTFCQEMWGITGAVWRGVDRSERCRTVRITVKTDRNRAETQVKPVGSVLVREAEVRNRTFTPETPRSRNIPVSQLFGNPPGNPYESQLFSPFWAERHLCADIPDIPGCERSDEQRVLT